MNPILTAFRRHIAWRPHYYKRLWRARHYLRNYRAIVRSSPQCCPEELQFRAGYNWRIAEVVTDLQVFDEVFGQQQYRLRAESSPITVVDIGANNGLFSLYAHIKCPSARIFSIEANPFTYESLSKNVHANGLQEVMHVSNLAICSWPGSVTFYCSPTSGWSSLFPTRGAEGSEAVSVPSLSFSSFCAARTITQIDVLKADVEGAEYDILLGDPHFFDIPIREIYLEVDRQPRDNKHKFEDLINLLGGRYRSVVVHGSKEADYPLVHCRDQVR